MKRKRTVLQVKLLLDPITGWGSEPEDHVKFLQQQLNTTIPWYKPEVELIRVEEVPDDKS